MFRALRFETCCDQNLGAKTESKFCTLSINHLIIAEQEGNGPLDSRAKVMNSDKKCGPIYLKSETNSYCSCILHRSYLTEQESDGEFTN